MFKYLRTEAKPLSPQLANEFATMTHFDGERPLKTARLEYLRKELEEGRFYSPRWAIARIGVKTFRMNGQHSSSVLTTSNGVFPAGLHAFIDVFEGDSEADLPDIFALFDRPESNRTGTDRVIANARVHPELNDVSSHNVRDACAGIAFALTQDEKSDLSVEDRAKLVHDHIDFVLWVSPFISCSRLRRTPAVAALFKTFEKDQGAAHQFWDLVQQESHTDQNNPTRWLARLLLQISGRTKKVESRSKNWSTRAIYVKCLLAWNAWRRGTVTDGKYHASSAIPKVL
jgi:hypothetical protein